MRMKPIKFHAVFLPKVHKFKVELTWPGQRFVELMTVSRFLRFAKEEGWPKIGGVQVRVDGDADGKVLAQVRGYLRQVADSYKRTFFDDCKNN